MPVAFINIRQDELNRLATLNHSRNIRALSKTDNFLLFFFLPASTKYLSSVTLQLLSLLPKLLYCSSPHKTLLFFPSPTLTCPHFCLSLSSLKPIHPAFLFSSLYPPFCILRVCFNTSSLSFSFSSTATHAFLSLLSTCYIPTSLNTV